jgi:hypothetical protein
MSGLSILLTLRTWARSRAALQLEILACGTNCGCCRAPGHSGGDASQSRTVGSGSCSRVSEPNGERRSNTLNAELEVDRTHNPQSVNLAEPADPAPKVRAIAGKVERR